MIPSLRVRLYLLALAVVLLGGALARWGSLAWGRGSPSSRLMVAITRGNAREVRRLLDAGADPNARYAGPDSAALPAFAAPAPTATMTPLHLAAGRGDEAMVRDLLDRGAQVNAVGKDGLTPLMLAAAFGHSRVERLLLARGADAGMKNMYGETAPGLARAYRDRQKRKR